MKQAIDLLRGELEALGRAEHALTDAIALYVTSAEAKRVELAAIFEKRRVLGEAIAALEGPAPAAVTQVDPPGGTVGAKPPKRR